ncbi:MAG: hypothetical protein A2W31_05005 [Planctomycetes bacterium RBG_16_64_10]|nr:MAG: hypothetical protein A2W31_05005 [Planctomycetes bacterium RBG_16_64_10]
MVFDNCSTDRTCEIAKACPVARLAHYDTGGLMRDDINRDIKSEVYQNAGKYALTPPVVCDWAINVDADEVLYHPAMRAYLQSCTDRGITQPSVTGFEMIADGLPVDDGRQIWEHVHLGYPWFMANKPCCVHSSLKVKYAPGGHGIEKYEGKAQGSPERELKLLHYKWLGWPYVEKKLRGLKDTLSPQNWLSGWGTDLIDVEAQKKRFEARRVERREVVSA